MKNRLVFILLSLILLATISYDQILDKIFIKEKYSITLLFDSIEDDRSAKETSEESSQDEIFFKQPELKTLYSRFISLIIKNNTYQFYLSIYYPEITSPPPQG